MKRFPDAPTSRLPDGSTLPATVMLPVMAAPPVETVRPVAVVTVPVKFALEEMVCPLIRPEVTVPDPTLIPAPNRLEEASTYAVVPLKYTLPSEPLVVDCRVKLPAAPVPPYTVRVWVDVAKTAVVPPVTAPALTERVPSVRVPPVMVEEALMVVAPAIAPALVIPPALLLMPPDTESPPALIVAPVATVTVPVKLAEAEMVCPLIVLLVARVVTPEIAPAVVMFTPVEVRAKVPVPFPIAVLPEVVASEVPIVELSEVKAPVEAVVAPIAVPLIPVPVVLMLLAVMVSAEAPVLIEEAPRPERLSAPEVPVIFTAPVVTVRPLEAVRSPAEVMVPEPVAEMLPEVVIASPALLGLIVVEARDQKPTVPVLAVVSPPVMVRFPEASRVSLEVPFTLRSARLPVNVLVLIPRAVPLVFQFEAAVAPLG